MINQLLPMLYILIAGVSIYVFISTLFAANEDSKSLQWASGNEPDKSKSSLIEMSRSLTHQFTIQWALKIKSQRRRKKIEKLLLTSGLSSELNVDEFIGMQILWGFLFPIILLILNFALSYGYSPLVFIAFAIFGWNIPVSHANASRKSRQTSVRIDLPFFTDLLALATEAGLDFQGGIQRIVERTRGKSVLADELNGVLRDITLGSSRAQALKGLANRLDMSEVSSFVNVVIDADSTGSSIERFVRAEKAGAQASQKILIPLMLFILPAVFIMIFAPVALNFMGGK
jgi:tight adherence protein C